jgi:hypothetical protein
VSLRFPYQHYSSARPIISLPGRAHRSRPVIAVTLLGPAASLSKDALVDTGADDTIFPENVARTVGIDLSAAPQMTVSALGTNAIPLRLVQVMLRVADANEQREWLAWVGFTPARLRHPVLGYAGFLQYFTATFFSDTHEMQLQVNSGYSGT